MCFQIQHESCNELNTARITLTFSVNNFMCDPFNFFANKNYKTTLVY